MCSEVWSGITREFEPRELPGVVELARNEADSNCMIMIV